MKRSFNLLSKTDNKYTVPSKNINNLNISYELKAINSCKYSFYLIINIDSIYQQLNPNVHYYDHQIKQIASADYFYRLFYKTIFDIGKNINNNTNIKNEELSLMLYKEMEIFNKNNDNQINHQYILEHNHSKLIINKNENYKDDNIFLSLLLSLPPSVLQGNHTKTNIDSINDNILNIIHDNYANSLMNIVATFTNNLYEIITTTGSNSKSSTSSSGGNDFVSFILSAYDQHVLRELVFESGGVAFVANNSLLPRKTKNNNNINNNNNSSSSSDDNADVNAVPFQSPASLEHQFHLPYAGTIKGMLIKKGITIITGGGYHGKSTLLQALAVGIYLKIPGDGREYVVCVDSAMSMRCEDGRRIHKVNVSPFISDLPQLHAQSHANPNHNHNTNINTNSSNHGSKSCMNVIDTYKFTTTNASGSTSQAANVIEAINCRSKLFLFDEDTCANNFMIRDGRMRSLIAREPITPYIYRCNGLYTW